MALDQSAVLELLGELLGVANSKARPLRIRGRAGYGSGMVWSDVELGAATERLIVNVLRARDDSSRTEAAVLSLCESLTADDALKVAAANDDTLRRRRQLRQSFTRPPPGAR